VIQKLHGGESIEAQHAPDAVSVAEEIKDDQTGQNTEA
jgi:hypothetical protein